jgi:hypothetical protein
MAVGVIVRRLKPVPKGRPPGHQVESLKSAGNKTSTWFWRKLSSAREEVLEVTKEVMATRS